MIKVLFTRKITEKSLLILDSFKNIQPIYLPQDKVHQKDCLFEILKKNQDIQGILCIANDKIDKNILSNAPKLKVVSTISVGFDHIDLKTCKELGIKVGHTPDTVTEATADITVALLLSVARRLTEGVEMAKSV